MLITANMPSRTSITSSLSGHGSALSAHARASFPKSDIQIHLKHHYKSKTYTTSSPLEGEVTITTQRDIRFDSIEIVLLGSSKTRTEGYSAPHETTHTFLKLTMPISESKYPVPRLLETGQSLTIPFNFVLPSFLTINACHHKIDSDHVRSHHLCLPPSMGSWARGNWETDDLAPHMAEVEYSIKARVWREPELGGRPIRIMEAVKPIQVLPAYAEDAPLNITKKDHLYKMSKTKTLRKNLISSKLGQLTVSGQQPRAIMLYPDGRVSAGTTAQLDLKFEPVSPGSHPPKITGVSTKISAHTYYSAGAIHSLPNTGEWMREGFVQRRGVYSTSVGLHSQCPENVSWRTNYSRRDSGYDSETAQESVTSSEDDCDAPLNPQSQPQHRRSIANLMRPNKAHSPSPAASSSSFSSPSGVFHTASVQLPITLPTAKKTFVPTFHSCTLSRVYTLHVALTVASASATGSSSTVSLDLPLQVAIVGPHGTPLPDREELPSWEDAVEDAAVDEFLRPRVLGVPEDVPGDDVREMRELPGYARR